MNLCFEPKIRHRYSITWALTTKQMKKLQVTQNAMLRRLLGIRLADKVNLSKIYEKTKARKARVVARTLKFKYAGHLSRDLKNKWNVILTSWVPHWGKRSRGRPRRRWVDEVVATAGSDWRVKAKDRIKWKGPIFMGPSLGETE